MCWFWFPVSNFCRDSLILLKVCRRIYHCKIQVRFNIRNHPLNFGWVLALFQLSFCWCVDTGFPLNSFCRDALILSNVCSMIYHCKIQVKFDIGNHPQNFGQVMALLWLSFCCWSKVKILFPLNNFWRDALISLEVCRMVYHYSIEVKFDFGNHSKTFQSNHSPLFTWLIKFWQSSEGFPFNRDKSNY